jgi:hypothetical protein
MVRKRELPICMRYLAGAAGGAAGTFAMDFYMRAMKKLSPDGCRGKPREHLISLIGRRHEKGESSTAALGRMMYEAATGERPSNQTRKKLSKAVHWGYGIDLGGAYGAFRGRKPKLDVLGGLVYGAGLWVLGDEIAVPLLGLAEGPKAYPKKIHAESLGAHLIYGAATAVATQLLRRII